MENNIYYPSLITSLYNLFLYFLEGQVHKDSKLGIVTNAGKKEASKSYLYKHSQNKWWMCKQFW